MKTYPAYKDSGVAWLREIPEDWQTMRAKWLFSEVSDKNHPNEQLLSATQDRGVFPRNESENRVVMPMGELSGFKLVKEGDFVISLRSFQGGIEYSAYRGLVSPAYVVLRPRREMQNAFFKWLLKTKSFIQDLNTAVSGIRQGKSIVYEDFAQLILPLPPRREQDAMVAFLEAKEREIQMFIRHKRRTIELLREQKAALINRAVTRGLNPDAPLKPSGLAWLGDIPAQWTRIPVKRLLNRMDYGTSESTKTGGGPIRVLTMGNIQDGEIKLPEEGGLDSVPSDLFLEEHDLLFNRTNSPELVGKVGIFRGTLAEQVSFASYLVRLRVKKDHEPEFVSFLLNSKSFWSYAKSQALVSLHQANINSFRYGQMLLAVPPQEEQNEIVSFIKNESAKIAQTIQTTESEIALIEEYRAALIDAAVTGKIDCR